MNLFGSRAALVGLALAGASLSGCSGIKPTAAEPEPKVSGAPDRSESIARQVKERGYADLGEGVFLIPGGEGRGLKDQVQFAQAIANFRKDHPELEIAQQIKVDGDTAYGHRYPGNGSLDGPAFQKMDGVVLWTAPKAKE